MTNRKMLEYMDNERYAWFMVVIMPYLYLIQNKNVQKFVLEEQLLWFEQWLEQSYDPSVMDLFPERMRKW